MNPVPVAVDRRGCRCTCGCWTRRRRYASDLTDAQWEILKPLLPAPLTTTGLGGRPEKHSRRTMIDAIFYVVDNGNKWRNLPADFPPWQTVYGMLRRWSRNLATHHLLDTLRRRLRTALGRNARPSAGCIDSQSVHKTAEATVPRHSSGFDPHKKVNGRKRHIVTDTLGLLVSVVITPANVQDRDAAWPALHGAASRGLTHVWADQGYEGPLTEHANNVLGLTVNIVYRHPGQKGFQVLPRRWVVERTLAWISRRRRCARDYERLPEHHATIVCWAAIIHMTRRLARLPHTTQQDPKQPL
ncbi:putative transposase [Saccharopolyspora antimicrobica]|uniref:Transposase n=2 Tax=Saccharopolyspora antimicrobica TaxID=455193 RepID=A0ABX9TAG7_9PSEU|nr:putative transposase [Saccharopolyspora antimicrobica]RKT82430.1 putative transposase [Saccharopolyspora antimicrobica]RKT83156.1 putative transposase [Saccharopolyspora antimicrobica]RKT84024.1 putative transposase [Saccharopolyspora antimicrobica]RKT86065.1 putative transposase [Saccharopolyspora antimicrobica]